MTATRKSAKPTAKLSMSLATGKITAKQPPKGLEPKDAKLEAKRAAAKAELAAAAKANAKKPAGKAVDHSASNKRIAAMLKEEAAPAPKAKKGTIPLDPVLSALVEAEQANTLMEDSKKAQALVEADRLAAKAGLAPMKHKPALELDNDITPAVVCRRRGTSYTCIRLSIGERFTHFITMEKLTLEKQDNRTFHEEWAEFNDYPVRRAAEIYLADQHRTIESQARTHLESIVKDPKTVYNLESQPKPVTTKEDPMATAKKTATAPATKTAKNQPPANAKPAAKGAAAPAAKTPAAKTPAKTAPAAKSAPAKNGIATVVSGAKPPAKQAANATGAKAPGFATRDTGTYKVVPAPADKPRRGNTAANMAVLEELQKKLKGKFTKAQAIEALTPSVGVDEAKSVFADGKYRKLIVEA